MNRWTEAQFDAINSRRGTILVSAAAGSGKTSVLVQRLIERLTDETQPCPADKVLVVTYTKAAAGEMKERVDKALMKLILDDPTNKNLQMQQMLIPQMNISTVHSFCSKLCKEYFFLLDISQDFKIVSDRQQDDMMYDAVKIVSDNFMRNENYKLFSLLSGERNDLKLHKTIISLYNYSRSHLDPENWLEKNLKMYERDIDFQEREWSKVILDEVYKGIVQCIELTKKNIERISFDDDYLNGYGNSLNFDLETLENFEREFHLNSWDEKVDLLAQVTLPTIGRISAKADQSMKPLVMKNRDRVKAIIKEVKSLMCESEKGCTEDMENAYVFVKDLCFAVSEFAKVYSAFKKDKNFLDYSDLEHFTLNLLLDKNDGKITPSEIAVSLSDNFNEIMVDEYQDSNEVQDWIFTAISKQDSNRFMVGDLKQCIYSFRQAMPQIFTGYKDLFSVYDREIDNYPAVVNLDQNFRSRQNVIDSVNFIFETLMSREVGGVDYVDSERLKQGAIYPEGKNCDTELDFLPETDEHNDVNEARHIAKKIHDIINSDFTVSENGESRKATFKDFCILQRSVSSHAHAYAKILEEYGIPTRAQSQGNFFDSVEIKQVVSFLQVVDNPNQDIPLLSVLMGAVYGFSPSLLSKLRRENKEISLYSAVSRDESGVFTSFLNDLNELRLISACTPSDLFLDILYEKTSYPDLVSAMKNGETRLSNLKMLRQYAGEYESSGYIGVAGFVRYIEKMKSNGFDVEASSQIQDDANLVEIMSIHKSKGLEFPVCFVAGCGRDKQTEKNDVVLNSKLGIGLKLKSEITGVTYSNFMREAVKLKNRKDEIGEELRILYVAATRAREKLIFVSTLSNLEKTTTDLVPLIGMENGINPYSVGSIKSFSKWLLLCALKHPDGSELRRMVGFSDEFTNHSNYSPWKINTVAEYGEIDFESSEEENSDFDENLYTDLKEKLSFEYPNAHLNKLCAKVTASAVSLVSSTHKKMFPRPAFMSKTGLNSTERGNAMHNYMQYCDFERAVKNPEKELSRLLENGFISKEHARVVDFSMIKAFFNSDLGRRMIINDTLEKEFRFSARIPATMVDSEHKGNSELILQGAVDCVFVENDELFVVDYKTDVVDEPQELIERHEVQLKLYIKALQKIKNMRVGGCFLYSFHMGKEVEIK